MEDRKTKVILSFDDGRGDNYRVAMEELLPRNLKATFNITTGYVNGDIDKNNIPCENTSMSIDNVIELGGYNEIEIAGHGHEHLNTLEDWKKGIDILANWLGNKWARNEGIGIASPHSQMSASAIRAMSEELEQLNIRYVRIGLSNQMDTKQRIISKLAREIKSNKLFYLPIANSLQKLDGDMVVFSVPIVHAHTVAQIKYTIDKAVYKQKDIVIMFHSIVKKNEDYYDNMWSWDYSKFVELCDYLVELRKQNQIRVTTTMEAFAQLC